MPDGRDKGLDDLAFTIKGEPVGDIRVTWSQLCERACVPDLLFHDLRRSAARNLRRMGVSEEVAMRIGGWRTSSVFKRYSIVAGSDIADVARLHDKKRETQELALLEERARLAPILAAVN
jgi:hypothetical protein